MSSFQVTENGQLTFFDLVPPTASAARELRALSLTVPEALLDLGLSEDDWMTLAAILYPVRELNPGFRSEIQSWVSDETLINVRERERIRKCEVVMFEKIIKNLMSTQFKELTNFCKKIVEERTEVYLKANTALIQTVKGNYKTRHSSEISTDMLKKELCYRAQQLNYEYNLAEFFIKNFLYATDYDEIPEVLYWLISIPQYERAILEIIYRQIDSEEYKINYQPKFRPTNFSLLLNSYFEELTKFNTFTFNNYFINPREDVQIDKIQALIDILLYKYLCKNNGDPLKYTSQEIEANILSHNIFTKLTYTDPKYFEYACRITLGFRKTKFLNPTSKTIVLFKKIIKLIFNREDAGEYQPSEDSVKQIINFSKTVDLPDFLNGYQDAHVEQLHEHFIREILNCSIIDDITRDNIFKILFLQSTYKPILEKLSETYSMDFAENKPKGTPTPASQAHLDSSPEDLNSNYLLSQFKPLTKDFLIWLLTFLSKFQIFSTNTEERSFAGRLERLGSQEILTDGRSDNGVKENDKKNL